MNTPSLFDRAANVFDGWTDPETGARVLRIFAKNLPRLPGFWGTYYHQFRVFLDGGRKVLLHASRKQPDPEMPHNYAVDLTTGQAAPIAPPEYGVAEVIDETNMATLQNADSPTRRTVLWDLKAGKELASMEAIDGWTMGAVNFLSDGRRALNFHYRGQIYHEKVDSRHYLLTPGEKPRLILDAEGYYCSHLVACPTDPNLYAYDRWPCPKRDVDQAITVRTLDGSFEEPAKLDARALRPADMWGCRDHYVWTPDGKRIVSYLFPHPMTVMSNQPGFNHFQFEWWLSALDWRTGEDLAAKYPPGRWGGHMQVTPDSRYILCAGGPGYDKLFAVEIEGLRRGWNEHLICSYPKTISAGKNSDPFPYPFALPDSSGVIFTAGWPGDDFGVYLAEWPKSLR